VAPRSRRLLASTLVGLAAASALAFFSRSGPRRTVSPGQSSPPPSPPSGSVGTLRITLLVDNNPGPADLRTAWGFSALVEADGVRILFDSGPDPAVLEQNAERLGVNLSDIDLVVVSHEHGDHVGGLSALPPGLRVYVPGGMNPSIQDRIRSMGFEVVELEDPTEISTGVWTTGSMWGPPAEQGLVINVSGLGGVLITGCAHPKVENMAQRASEMLGVRLYAVIGGFHLGSASRGRLEGIARVFRSLGVEFVAPVHCSGDRARSFFQEAMPGAYGDGHVGSVLTFSESGVSAEG